MDRNKTPSSHPGKELYEDEKTNTDQFEGFYSDKF